jgi:hypothetical protein
LLVRLREFPRKILGDLPFEAIRELRINSRHVAHVALATSELYHGRQRDAVERTYA